ncbi:hypothetical protein JCM11251_007564 [Rhodosporidiobolus azoricus]
MSLLRRLLPSSSSSAPTSSRETFSSVPLLPLDESVKRVRSLFERPDSRRRRSLLFALALPLFLLVFVVLFLTPTPSVSPPRDRLSDEFERQWRYRNGSNADVFEKLWIHEPGRGEGKASFIALGASLVDLFVPDRIGVLRDVSLGYENTTQYATDLSYPYFGAIVGRYANRIANASFTLPSGEIVPLPANDHSGRNTLHGGQWGYSRSGWRVSEHLENSITFELRDEEGTEGFPSTVLTTATYTLSTSPLRLTTHLSARVLPSSSGKQAVTPILLSSHLYFNLDGYYPYPTNGGEVGGGSAKGHGLWVDGDRFVETDGNLIPTGSLPTIARNSALDFRSLSDGSLIGEKLALEDEVEGLCGTGCSGIDNALLFSPPSSAPAQRYRNDSTTPVLVLSSPHSGIRMTLRTNQPAVHLYTCNAFSTSPTTSASRFLRKASHRLPPPASGDAEEREADLFYPHQSCLAIEPEGLIDAVHHYSGETDGDGDGVGRKEEGWGFDPFWSEERGRYDWWSEYAFDWVG